ncbi:hypothetical protein RV11_GL000364 [Enterococcus phoeniculicola]|nr:hypothetical protein RV11_GL000364 [Enterococcus phoeniculicola]
MWNQLSEAVFLFLMLDIRFILLYTFLEILYIFLVSVKET